MIRGLHHVAISTRDIERLLAFYTDVIGCEVVIRFNWERGYKVGDEVVGLKDSSVLHAMVRAGNAYIEMFQFLTPSSRHADLDRPVNDAGISHFCFDVGDVLGEYDRLLAAGVRFNCPPREMGGMVRTVYGRDPDGNVLEFQQIIDPTVAFVLPPFEGAVIRA